MQLFRDALGTKLGVWPGEQVNIGLWRPAECPHPPSLPAAIYRADRSRSAGREPGIRAPSHPPKTCTARQSRARMASPVELCMKSMRNTTGLGPGADVARVMQLPRDTLATKSRVRAHEQAKPRAQAPSRSLTRLLSLPPFTEPTANQRLQAPKSAPEPGADRPPARYRRYALAASAGTSQLAPSPVQQRTMSRIDRMPTSSAALDDDQVAEAAAHHRRRRPARATSRARRR